MAWVGWLWVAPLIALPRAHADDAITYTLTPQPERGELAVSIQWRTGQRERSALRIAPRWGNVDDLPGLLENVVIDGGKASELRRGVWAIAHRPRATITCEYRVRAAGKSFGWSRTYAPVVQEDFFHGLGNSFLLAPGGVEGVPTQMEVLLRWQLPASWKAVCSWGVGRSVGRLLHIEDLRHATYYAGTFDVRSVQREGYKLTVAMPQRFEFSIDRFLELTQAIIAGQCAFLKETAFPDYVVVAVPIGAPLGPGETRVAGVGLYHSFVLFAAPGSKLNDGVEQLFAHELFHHWNGGLMRAAEPEELIYWFSEGFTDYYAMRILLESGYWDASTFAKWANRHAQEYLRNPAIQASNQQIAAEYWAKRDSFGQMAYQRGFLLALRWHHLARQRGVSGGLDPLFMTLLRQGRGGTRIDNALIREAGVATLGTWFGPEFDRHVVQAEPVDIPTAALEPALRGRVTSVHDFELGFDRQRSLEAKRVLGLLPESAAARAGLREGDTLTGWSLHGDVTRKIVLKIRRDGAARTIEYLPRGRARDAVQFEAAPRSATNPTTRPGSR